MRPRRGRPRAGRCLRARSPCAPPGVSSLPSRAWGGGAQGRGKTLSQKCRGLRRRGGRPAGKGSDSLSLCPPPPLQLRCPTSCVPARPQSPPRPAGSPPRHPRPPRRVPRSRCTGAATEPWLSRLKRPRAGGAGAAAVASSGSRHREGRLPSLLPEATGAPRSRFQRGEAGFYPE